MANLTEYTDQTFDSEVLDSQLPVLVDFWAEWCGPCRAIAPEVEALASETGGKLKVGKLDVDANPDIAKRYGVLSIPTLILFVDGAEKSRLVGLRRKTEILSEIGEFVANGAGESATG